MRRFQIFDPLQWPGWARGALVAFLVLSALRSWVGAPPVLDSAVAQIPDSLAQRRQMIDESKTTNQLLSDIKRVLESGTLNVRIAGADNPSDAQPKARTP